MLKRVFTIAAFSVLAGGGMAARAAQDAPAAASQATQPATIRDVQELQFDLENLDESLQNLDANDPRYQDLQQRVDWLRQDVNRLEQQIRDRRRADASDLGASEDQVQKLRDDVRALQRDMARSGERWDQNVTLPQGTEVQVDLDQPLSSASARVEDRVTASVARPVVAEGRVVIPAGTRVEGTVQDAQPASRPARGGRLDLSFDRLVLDDGRSLPLQSRLVSVGQQRSIDRRAAGIGAILGGVLGEVMGGTKGAIVGVIVGGAGGIAASAGRNVDLPAGAELTLRLERPLAMADWTPRQ